MPRFTRSRLSRLHVHLERLLQAPAVDGLSHEDAGGGGGQAQVQLRGVVCGVCALRSEAALRGVAGVEAVSVDLATQRATLRLSPGATVGSAELSSVLQQGLERAVVGMAVRRWIERLAVGLRTDFRRARS
jgi:copper chaperone CopZ